MQTPEFASKPRIAFTGKRGKDQHLAMLSALAALFENGFSIDFVSLHAQMQYKIPTTDIPTYPFQRKHNYPAFIPNRNNTLGIGSLQIPAIPQFTIDQALCDFLDFHRIEGRPVLPGAAMVDYFARSAESKLLKSFQFHVPLVLENPETQVVAEIDDKGFCKLVLRTDEKIKICSGFIGEKSTTYSPRAKLLEVDFLRTMSKAEIYACFRNVQFGDIFQTIQCIAFWDTHADGDVIVGRTDDSSHDRIRKLDACLHMFAAVSSQFASPMDETNGAYLPTSLEDFRLHKNDLPDNFVCRYYLPLEIGRGGRSLSASFEAFNTLGELLVSCKRYTLAWVPHTVVHKEQKVKTSRDNEIWFRNGWTVKPLATQKFSAKAFDELLYISNGSSSRMIQALSSTVNEIIPVQFSVLSETPVQNPVIPNLKAHSTTMRGQDVLVVVDLTEVNHFPGSVEFESAQFQVLESIKHLLECKLHISSFLALTSWCSPVDLRKEGLCLFSNPNASARALVGAIIHGMVRVIRRENNLDAWCLDLPSPDTLRKDHLIDIIGDEIHSRKSLLDFDSMVCYREDAQQQSLARLVPILEPFHHVPSRSPSGTIIIVGLGSIGAKLAVALVKAGVDHIVFFGRRSEANVHVGHFISIQCHITLLPGSESSGWPCRGCENSMFVPTS